MALVQKSFSELITFSRSSNATRIGPTGLVEYAPHNLLTYSKQFNDAAWPKTGASVTANTIIAPDGTVTGDSLIEDATLNAHRVRQIISVTSGFTYTISVFAKASTRTFLQLFFNSTEFGANAFANFDLSTGALGTVGSASTAVITSVGNGWYRCSMSAAATATGAASAGLIQIVTSGTAARNESYTGDGISGLYLWGAQLAVGPYPLDYTPTTSAAVYGPRFDYDPVTLAAQELLVEEQRTNLLTYSEDLTQAAWNKTLGTVTVTVAGDATISPDGTVDADKVITANATGDHVIAQVTSVTSGTTYTQTWFLKAAELNWVQVTESTGFGSTQFQNINLSNGTTGNGNYGSAVTVTAVGNGWYRVSVTDAATATSASGRFLLALLTSDVAARLTDVTGNGTDGVFVWGAQLEAGAFATSYIPTVAAQVTRSADSVAINTLSPWFNASEGTLFAEGTVVNNISGTTARSYAEIGNSSSGAERFVVEARATTSTRARIVVGAVSTNSSVNYNALGTNTKIAGAYGADGVTVCVAGLSPVTTATSVFGTVTSLFLGAAYTQTSATNINGYLRRIAYYPRRLTNAELQALTA